MLYLMSQEKFKRLRLPNDLGDDQYYCNVMRVDSWQAVTRREPNQPWEHMSTLYGKYRGQSALILGCGPSIKSLDPERKLKSIVFAMNRSILWKRNADYWCVTDEDVIKTVPWDGRVRILANIQLYPYLLGRPAVMVEYDHEPMRWRNPDKRPLYWAESTLSWTLHLCIRMGFAKLYFLGNELSTDPHWDGYVANDEADYKDQHMGVMARIIEMFGPHRSQWDERSGEYQLWDASGGHLPVPKCSVKDIP